MKLSIIMAFMLCVACQGKKQDSNKMETVFKDKVSVVASDKIDCDAEVCLDLRNHDASNQSFEIYMINSVPIAGFQCDLPGVSITGSDGGLLKENEYQTSNSAGRILSFSMQAQLIPPGNDLLTKIYYSDPSIEVCITDIIFAGSGGAKLTSNTPECMKLN